MCAANRGKMAPGFYFLVLERRNSENRAAAGVVGSASARPAAGTRGKGGMLPPDHIESVNLSLRPGRGGAGRRGEQRAASTIRNFRARPGSLGGGNKVGGG